MSHVGEGGERGGHKSAKKCHVLFEWPLIHSFEWYIKKLHYFRANVPVLLFVS